MGTSRPYRGGLSRAGTQHANLCTGKVHEMPTPLGPPTTDASSRRAHCESSEAMCRSTAANELLTCIPAGRPPSAAPWLPVDPRWRRGS